MRCKTLTAIYKNEINTLKKLYEIDFLIHKSVRIHIEQFTVRKIEIDFTSEQLVDDLIAVLTKVERLLMLFDGYFMNLISIEFQDSAGCVPPNLKECAEHFMRRRLAYFHSNKILFSSNYLLDFSKVLTPALYEKWKGILEDLDVAHQVYLYSLCDTNQPVDLRCAFLIELAEPVVEIVKANSPLFESLNPGKQGTSLRDCLRALITTYGSDIFENEINSCFETFLKSLVNSRVRIMHIKRNCSGSYLNGPESVLYSIKISFLYRIVLFNLLGISPSLYHENLISNIQRWNSWNDIMDMLKILICDDDPTFAQSMFKRILSLPAYSSKSMKLSCLTDIAEMSANTIAQYDILFLDIDLGKESGIDLARKMRKMNPEAVLIFVTNFSEYAPEGYEVDAFRYLAKSELEKKLPTYFEDALAMCRTRQRKVEILCEGESVPIPVQSLAWIESQGREQYLHLVGGCREQLITRLTMAQLEDLLVPHGFLRIHKSYLVNMAYLQSFQSTSAVLTIGQTLPVGARSYRDNKQKFVRWQAQQLW